MTPRSPSSVSFRGPLAERGFVGRPFSQLANPVRKIRTEAGEGLPAGGTAEVTGGEGFKVDLAAVFEGANVSLPAVTATVVAVLPLLTYRSPWL
ncbi:MMPL family transporter [Planotetraspora sp. A-T 1434]|uniref:MMPL family transporter n=1 Tax=Planotetraspora sp. A-T 1434 TaxID=2979219 RepID=UPI0021C074BA|nr:MMPL family transporter [Planotetraspora sp. A-T 1434]MCT9934833.1 MMPL family transporter [Planotetraspora sp. A-T 1434]